MVVQTVIRLRVTVELQLTPKRDTTVLRLHPMIFEVVMKRRKIALSLMATFCLSSALSTAEARADNPFEKLIPRGKLLKMLKDEITGESDAADSKQQAREARPRTGKAPTPVTRTPDSNASRSRQPMPSPAKGGPQLRSVVTRPLPPMQAQPNALTARNVSAKATQGFGMTVSQSKNDQLIVTGVDPNGNAASAGFRPGDQLIAMGGGKLSALEEYEQISKTLGQGDQVEIGFVRRGKNLKSLLQYGTVDESAALAGNAVMMPETNNVGMQSVLDAPVEHVSRLKPIVQTEQRSKVGTLNQTIESQRLRMQAMAEELELLRRSHQPAVEPTRNNWSFPDLSGPEMK